jgi:hypothetical protein
MPSVHYNIHNIVLQVEVLNKSYKAYSLYLAYPVHQHHLTPNHPSLPHNSMIFDIIMTKATRNQFTTTIRFKFTVSLIMFTA